MPPPVLMVSVEFLHAAAGYRKDLAAHPGRRGARHKSFFNLLKRERIRRRTYRTRDEARQDVFDCIEMFYNPTRKHVRNGMLSPVTFERQHKRAKRGCPEKAGLFNKASTTSAMVGVSQTILSKLPLISTAKKTLPL